MATTSRGIPLIDGASIVQPIQTPLNAMANGVNNALDELADEFTNSQAFFEGTTTARLALAAPKLRDGITWSETNTGKLYNRRGGLWIDITPVVNLGSTKKTDGSQGNITTTPTELAGISISVTLPSSAKLRFLATVETYSSSPADVIYIFLRDGTTNLAHFTRQANSSPSILATSISNTVIAEVTLSAGAHRFNIAIQRAAGSGAITSSPSALAFNMLSVDRIGE